MIYQSFFHAIDALSNRLIHQSRLVDTGHWQGVSTQGHPEMQTHELLNIYFQVPLRLASLDHWRADTGASIPWADDHFAERVSGSPTNPGEAYKTWPWWAGQDESTKGDGKFSHSYQERFWPKHAGQPDTSGQNWGIRFRYGDLNDLVSLLRRYPTTRQAYLPIYFPEDLTASNLGQRVPCTLGYHFMMRNNFLHVFYPIRSCDFLRHFRNDCYLTVRLLLWVLDKLEWKQVTPGMFTMWIGSLHAFRNDMESIKRGLR